MIWLQAIWCKIVALWDPAGLTHLVLFFDSTRSHIISIHIRSRTVPPALLDSQMPPIWVQLGPARAHMVLIGNKLGC